MNEQKKLLNSRNSWHGIWYRNWPIRHCKSAVYNQLHDLGFILSCNRWTKWRLIWNINSPHRWKSIFVNIVKMESAIYKGKNLDNSLMQNYFTNTFMKWKVYRTCSFCIFISVYDDNYQNQIYIRLLIVPIYFNILYCIPRCGFLWCHPYLPR